MPSKITQYVAASDEAGEYAQQQLDDIQEQAREDIDRLMLENAARDDELWDELEVDNELVVADYEDVVAQERDINWSLGLAGLSAAATVQFFTDNRTQLLTNPLAYRAQLLSPFKLTRAELIQAGKRQVEPITIGRYKTLQAQYVNEFAAIQSLSNKELYVLLQENGSLLPMDKYISNQMGYVSRMTNYPSGSPQFKEAVANLTNANSKSALMSMNRRSVETMSMLRESEGDYNTEMCWILDPNSKHCPYCPSRAGDIKTLAEWIEDGLPGAEVCQGGDRCSCHLVKA